MKIAKYSTCKSNIKTGYTERVIGDFHAPCNLETNSAFCYQKGHGNFHVLVVTVIYENSLKGPWKFHLKGS